MIRWMTSLFVAFVFLQFSCTDYGIEPIKDPRSYTWTIDTLAYPGSFQTAMRDIWGSSPTNVYVVGHNSDGFGKMFHFDGQEWKPVGLNPIEGGTIEGPIDLSAIHGFSRDNIWVVGQRIYVNPNRPPNFLDSSLIIHYDGTQWKEQKVQGMALRDVWGDSPTNVFAVGDNGTMFHYDGGGWSREVLPYPVQLLSIGGDKTHLFTAGAILGRGAEDTLMIFSNTGHGWNVLDRQPDSEFSSAPRFGLSIYSPAAGVYYSSTWGVFQWKGFIWEKVLASPIALSVSGGGPNNIFAVGQFATVYHWNGNNWAALNIPTEQLPPDVWLQSSWTDGKEVFIVGFLADGSKTILLHGR